MLIEDGVLLVPEESFPFVGYPVPGTRMFRKDAPDAEMEYWWDAICSLTDGQVVSPGGAPMFAPVSRAAVHKRIKDGKLTAFFFYPTTEKRSFFGQTKTKRKSPYGYIVVDELKLWGKELKERAIRQGAISREELEGEKPDWLGEFYEWNCERQRKRGKDGEK